MTAIVPPVAIGILGGGQLGRYALMAARTMGYRTIVLDPDPQAPAGRVADRHLVAAYDDPEALAVLAAECGVVTTEFENPPAAALEKLTESLVVAPSPAAVAIAQDRLAEKSFLQGAGVPVAPWARLRDESDLTGEPLAALCDGLPLIVKTARLGYDGKGQRRVDGGDVASVRDAWNGLGASPCVVERQVPLDVELSVILGRTEFETRAFAVAENLHVDGVLDLTVVPARIDAQLGEAAVALATRVADALAYVGVLAVEMFVSDGELLVNELAPRPHNSGHWTLDGARTDQFSQQVRAVTGAALGDPSMTTPAIAMVNLLGDLWFDASGSATSSGPVEPRWDEVLRSADARLHLYGKSAARPARKMGHLTVLGDDVDDVVARALALRAGTVRRR